MTLELASIVDQIKALTFKNFDYCIEDKENFLPPGATDSEIQQFENEFNLKLPDDVKEYLKLLNGEGTTTANGIEGSEVGMFLGLSALGLDDIKREFNIWKEVWDGNPEFAEEEYQSVPEGAINAKHVDADNWIGLTIDGCGNSIGIDLNPGPKGKAGQVISWGRHYYDDTVLIADSWTEFLAQLLQDLQAEGFYTVDKEYNVYDLPETNYLDYVREKKWNEYKGSQPENN
jgi:cell wall assembly regulator SMI1